MSSTTLYKILFLNQGKVYELYAQHVHPSNLPGFIEVETLTFGQTSTLVIDPQEEKIKTEFSGVSSTYIPTHLVLRIDEVDKAGVSKISAQISDDNIMPFPTNSFNPNKKNDD
ncbi:MAG: DUF1820 family protein [Methylococcales bacterium]|jgi:hypothetical protein|nr:DUF1820 family protein [Methylococcales bacterium]MBT7445987.1 DUF1820 family protein [Methylococcales bacterium]